MSLVAAQAYKKYFANADWQGSPISEICNDEPTGETLCLTYGSSDFGGRQYFDKIVNVARPRNMALLMWHEHPRLIARVSAQPFSGVKQVFEESLAQWKEDTKILSSVHSIILHKSYQRIIGLGSEVLPLIFMEYQKNGGHWHPALEAITGENPITEDCVGSAKKIREKWLIWASNNKYL